MPNKLFRARLLNSIDYALREAEDAKQLDHPGLIGRIRELCCEKLFRPMLPAGFEVGTGKITDKHGALTGEADLVVHCPAVLPAIMHSGRDGAFAVESSCYMVEVKSRLTHVELTDSVAKARKLAALDCGVPADPVPWTIPVLFAFGSDLVEGSSELERYARVDAEWRTRPLFRAICVAGRGYWWADLPNGWLYHPATPERDEIIDLVAGIANTLASRRHALPNIPLGRYLMAERRVHSIP